MMQGHPTLGFSHSCCSQLSHAPLLCDLAHHVIQIPPPEMAPPDLSVLQIVSRNKLTSFIYKEWATDISRQFSKEIQMANRG